MIDLFEDNDRPLLLGMSTGTFLYFKEKSNFPRRASLVWMAIYTLMTRKNFKKVTPSLEILCKMTGQSQSSVQRGLRELKSRGYLLYGPLYKNGKWCVNSYQCILPGRTVPEESTEIDYGHKEAQFHSVEVLDEYEDRLFEKEWEFGFGANFIEEEFSTKERTWVDLPNGKSITICELENNDSGDENGWELLKEEWAYNFGSTFLEEELSERMYTHEAIQNEEPVDKVDHYSNDPNLYILHNIGDCESFSLKLKEVDYSMYNNQIFDLKKSLKEIEEKENDINKRIADNVIDRRRVKDAKLALDLLGELDKITTSKEFIGSKIKYLEKELQEKRKICEQKNAMMTDESFLATKPGRREIPRGLLWWTKKQLYKIGIAKELVALKLNEIFHAVRYGSLSHVKYNLHEEMPIMKSINIALKLVRCGKWQSPASFAYGGADYDNCQQF